MKKLILWAFAAMTFGATHAVAQSPVVVELYTSQGCSSCPPADALLHELAERDDVIALALHVDYWDYIGWTDEFADPAHAQRQRGFARVGGRNSIYTPQMIVGGVSSVVGAKPMKLSKAIADHAAQAELVDLSLTRDGEGVRIAATSLGGQGPYLVQMVRYTPERTARITRGENAGHTLNYANVAESWTVLGQWDGMTTLELEVDAPGPLPVVVLIQEGPHGPIRAARALR